MAESPVMFLHSSPEGRARLFAARLLQSSARTIASAAIEDEQSADRPSPWTRRLAEAEHVVQLLADCVALGRPELFERSISWRTLAERETHPPLPAAALLDRIGRVLPERLPPAALASVQSILDAGLHAARRDPAEEPSHLDGTSAASDLARRYLVAALEGRQGDAVALLLAAADDGLPPSTLREQVLAPAQAEVGRLWHLGRLHIGEEHLVTRLTAHVLSLLQVRDATPPAESGCSVLCAAVGGDLHDMGLRLVTDAFAAAGWRTWFLGADVPTDALLASVRDFGPDLVALSANLVANVLPCGQTIQRLRQLENGRDLPVIVGGSPFGWAPGLHTEIGADGWAANAEDAVRLGAALVQRRRQNPL